MIDLTSGCPVPDEIQALLEDRLSGTDRAHLVAHAELCAECHHVLAALFGETTRPGVVGSHIGRFEVTGQLGLGAMGVVVSAFDPQLGRSVAIKLLRHDAMPCDEKVAVPRLLREAKAIAALSHPNIVTVYELGMLGDEVYVVMESVEGGTLRRWLHQRRRGWREVRDLFFEIGRGLAEAHAHGLVHRDFKPENVLVGLDGRPRITDFGLVSRYVDAQPASPSPSLEDRLTASGAFVGTPLYMAPEQLQLLEADARSDQFAFCVALHEALFDERPFEGTTLAELRHHVQRGRTRKISRGRVPSWLARAVNRGLRPAPEERHADMNALLGALSQDRARSRRFVALGLGLAIATFGAVALNASSHDERCRPDPRLEALWNPAVRGALRAQFADRARAATGEESFTRVAARIEAYADELAETRKNICLASVRGEQSPEALDLRMACLDHHRDELGARLRVLGAADAEVVARSGELSGELPALAECLELERLRVRYAPATAATRASVATLTRVLASARAQVAAGRPLIALAIVATAASAAHAVGYAPLDAEAAVLLGRVLDDVGQWDRAVAALERATRVADASADDASRVDAQIQLVRTVGVRLMRFADGHRISEDAQATLERWGPDLLRRAELATHLGSLYRAEGQMAAAREQFERALAFRARQLGAESYPVAISLNGIGAVASQQGKGAEAIALFRHAAEVAATTVGRTHPNYAIFTTNVALNMWRQGDPFAARPFFERALTTLEVAYGPNNNRLVAPHANLAELLQDLGDRSASAQHLARALAIEQRSPGNTAARADLFLLAGRVEARRGDFDEALAHAEQAVELLVAAMGPGHTDVADALRELANVELARGEPAAALELLERAEPVLRKTYGPVHEEVGELLGTRGAALARLGRFKEAESTGRDAVATLVEAVGDAHPVTARTRASLAATLLHLGRAHDAAVTAQAAEDVLARASGPADQVETLATLGRARLADGSRGQALEALWRAFVYGVWCGADLSPIRFGLAQALADIDPIGARALALEARRSYAQQRGTPAPEARELERWLAGQRWR